MTTIAQEPNLNGANKEYQNGNTAHQDHYDSSTTNGTFHLASQDI